MLEGGNITFKCPGTFVVKAGQVPFMSGAAATMTHGARLIPLPVSSREPDPVRAIRSTFAFDQLTEVANRSTPVEFVLMLAPIFGFDIPAQTYIKLQDALKQGKIRNPEHIVMSGGTYPADYDNEDRIIRVHAGAPDLAATNVEGARELLAVLLHEFGHHIDNVLRHDLADRNPDGTSTLGPDGPLEEGARYAYSIAVFDLETSSQTEYAQYESPDYTGPLKVNYAQARLAIQQMQGADAQRRDGRHHTRETFGAGRGEHHEDRPRASFGHESIEDVLQDDFPRQEDRKAIYFGNWLRDFSQIVDPKIVRPPGLPKDLGRYISREALTKVIDVLAGGEFYDLRTANPSGYTVTADKLGVYRPTEHIDNPKNINPHPPDPQSVDADFEPWVTADSPKLAVNPATSMKNYIADSRDSMRDELNRAAAAGDTSEGKRLLGSALHVLEDFFAHSNFVELSLRKVGFERVLPWTSPADCRHQYPLVTGMFGSTDVIASIAGPIAQALFPVEGWTFKASQPGQRSDSEKILEILLSEHSDPRYLTSFKQFLSLRDQWTEIPGHQYAELIGWVASAPMRAVLNGYNLVYQSLLHLVGNSVDDAQTHYGDPNTNGSTDPSHSQLAKDHDVHPLHVLAAKLAKYAVKQAGAAMKARWDGDTASDPGGVATAFFVHPYDSSWQDAIVLNWSRSNGANIERGESATILEHLHEAHAQETMEQVRRAGRYGGQGWEYIQRNYETLFGEENQVR
ncbi:HET-C-related protein [Novilysobacter spongiicola]|uniref:Heterokaryon incompatibility protein Het-C n=1 Tax=Lysobacter spongiicola DSM 21749 TaxID=1122188 RepID=A0A1T4NQY3_9GAMM|nr:HET-C-related protein [Lysobacter spongiicola]SJZ81680.1 Heterokaryon incompatibility protein Het-C [Lysobacter spongiicola DSM 21749]